VALLALLVLVQQTIHVDAVRKGRLFALHSPSMMLALYDTLLCVRVILLLFTLTNYQCITTAQLSVITSLLYIVYLSIYIASRTTRFTWCCFDITNSYQSVHR